MYFSAPDGYNKIPISSYGNGQLRNKSAGGRNQKSQTSPGCAPQLAPVSPPETQPGCGGGVSSSPSEESAFTELLVLRGQPQNSCKTLRKHSKTQISKFSGGRKFRPGTKSYVMGFPRIVGQPVSAKSTGIASMSSIRWEWGGMGTGVLDFWFSGPPLFCYWES